MILINPVQELKQGVVLILKPTIIRPLSSRDIVSEEKTIAFRRM